ncbi:hypothetical protein WJX72_011479 [[Myrmecia] bisecta]|uniref:Uncharacterized protein n=1 Tax=[Myrmecia] bisecta TaxID=41462 RepID=A0AAW1PGD7_9CHLO
MHTPDTGLNTLTQKPGNVQGEATNTKSQDGADARGTASRFNPTAAEFVPGGAGGGSRPPPVDQRPAGAAAVEEAGRAPSGRGRGRRGGGEGRHGPAPGEGRGQGGLSRAFRGGRGGRQADRGGHQGRSQGPLGLEANPGGRGQHDTEQRPPDSTQLGRSPSRGHVNANFLLNFQYERGSRGRGGGGPPGRGLRRNGPRPQPYDKNKFLQANFRFLVSDAGDLRKYEADADLMLDWDDVVEVEMVASTPIKCPISLDCPPLCAQITPCGHVFSFPSIMQHLMTHGGDELRKASPCPLCFNPIVARELRLVRVHQVQPPKVGQKVTFQLLTRPKGSIIPVEHVKAGSAGDQSSPASVAASVAAAVECSKYAKFTTVADAGMLWREAAEKLAEYAAQVTTEGGLDAAQEAPFIYSAIDALAARAASWSERRQRLRLDNASEEAAAEMPSSQAVGAAAAAAVRQVSTAAVTAASDSIGQAAAKAKMEADFPTLGASSKGVAIQPSPKRASQGGGAELSSSVQSDGGLSSGILGSSPGDAAAGNASIGSDFYFYQAADGQWLFLTALNMRALMAHFGSPLTCPATFTATLLEVEDWVQNEVVRKRLKFLSHLPLTGTFKMAEVDMHDLVLAESLAPFADEIKARAQRRTKRAEQEAEHAKREAEQEAANQAASFGPSVAELKAMPLPSASLAALAGGLSEEDALDAAIAKSLGLQGRDPDGEAAGADAALMGTSSSPPPPQKGISFAHMTRMGYAATGPTLSLGSGAAAAAAAGSSPSGSGPGPLHGRAWGPALGGEASTSPAPTAAGSSRVSWGSGGATMASHLAAAAASPAQGGESESSPAVITRKGKKGGKQMVLMSMNQRRY